MAMDVEDYSYVGRDLDDPFNANRINSGVATIGRRVDASSAGLATNSQTLYLTYFTADKSFTSANVAIPSGQTAAAATPTLARIGLYIVDGAGNLTLIASTANDTTLFAAVNTMYTKAWSAPVSVYKGQRYALGVLVVSAVAMPNFNGQFVIGAITSIAPRIAGQIATQADLPSSVAIGNVATSANIIYGEVRP